MLLHEYSSEPEGREKNRAHVLVALGTRIQAGSVPGIARFWLKKRGQAVAGELIHRDRFQIATPDPRPWGYVTLGGGLDSSVRLTTRARASALYGFGSHVTLEPEPSCSAR